MPDSDALSATESQTGTWWTRQITKINARDLRNNDDYDDWSYGTEPIPADTSWIQPKTLTQLHRHLIAIFAMADTIDSQKLAELAMQEILKLPLPVLQALKSEDANLRR